VGLGKGERERKGERKRERRTKEGRHSLEMCSYLFFVALSEFVRAVDAPIDCIFFWNKYSVCTYLCDSVCTIYM